MKYVVNIQPNYENATRYRVGRQFIRGESQVLDLSDEEAEEIKNDRYMEIREAEEEYAANSDIDARTSGTATQEESEDQVETAEDQSSEQEEEATGETQTSKNQLLRDNTKDELQSIAEDNGVEYSQDDTKSVLADKILGG